MQLNKQLIIIIVLASFLISSVVTALYFYKKNKDIIASKSELVTIYIAKEDIPVNTLLSAKHLAKTTIERQYVLNDPLLMNEIIGKYNNERIYKHEIFLKQKLDTKLKKEEKKILEFKKSAYNMKFELFNNPNYALQQGEYINIMTVYPKGPIDKKGRFLDFDVTYVAPNIKILGFIRDGRYESETFTKQTIKKVENKKLVEVVEDVKSDEIILDIDLNTLKNLIKNYNLGTQLWMTKIKHDENNTQKPVIDKKEEMEIIAKIEDVKVAKTKEPVVTKPKVVKPIKYEYKMYTPNNSFIKRVASIDYGNQKSELSTTKTINISVDKKEICSNIKDKFIVGTVNNFNIRSSASLSSKYKKSAKKNTIIPYISKDGNWYKICDGNYVHKSVTKEVDAKFVKNKLGKYE